MSEPARCHAVVPAAGSGSRLGAALPKQYLHLAGRSLLEWSVQALLDAPFIETVTVVVSPGDARAEALLGRRPRLRVLPVGGATRRDSVLAGVQAPGIAWSAHDWVLVHDAARPALDAASLLRLHAELADDPVGGLLAVPVSDTVKRAASASPEVPRVAATLSREGLWLAQTPQMFRHGVLLPALQRHPEVTDEAAAVEAEGLVPRLVRGERQNFKVTTADDLALMGAWLGRAGPA
ncbi:MAG: 2-C-methyl-D-erythritol 4-phosphate cytidylyltransferase [Burkholderiales bacterium]